MKEPVWVLREVVLMAHEQSLAQFGGSAGIRDRGCWIRRWANRKTFSPAANPACSNSRRAMLSVW
jgi:hypothetical protein